MRGRIPKWERRYNLKLAAHYERMKLKGKTPNDFFKVITQEVCVVMHQLRVNLEGGRRTREIVEARQWVWFFAKKFNIGTLAWLGEQFNKDHATALHGIKTIRNLIEADASKRTLYEILENRLNQKLKT